MRTVGVHFWTAIDLHESNVNVRSASRLLSEQILRPLWLPARAGGDTTGVRIDDGGLRGVGGPA